MTWKAVFLTLFMSLMMGCRAYHVSYSNKAGTTIEVSQLDENLLEVHFYHLIAQKHAMNGNHLKSLTALGQARKMEQKIVAEYLKASYLDKKRIKNTIAQFAQDSHFHRFSLKDLAHELNLNFSASAQTHREFQHLILALEKTLEFQVFETNVEHLSYMLEINRRL